jgi:hypothetical protein
MTVTLQPIRVATGFDKEGLMVFNGHHRLVAVLTHLSEDNELSPGRWYLEAGLVGRMDQALPRLPIWT